MTGLPELLEAAQRALLAALAACGLAPPVHGQPGWPFAWRIAVEVLAIDRGLQRALLVWTAAAALAAATLLAALAQRHRGRAWRRGAAAAAVPLLAAAAWTPPPPASLLFTAAAPTSFHRSPTAFSVDSIQRGGEVFARQCAGCHGSDARGEGPRAATLPMWPPDLTGGLLWRRGEGLLFAHLADGLHDRRTGRPTMPAFGSALPTGDLWAVLDWLQAQAAGQALQRNGRWPGALRVPDMAVQCDDGRARRLAAWTGQRLRLVAAAGPVAEDPRFITVALGAQARAECVAADPAAWAALALLAGVPADRLAGTQFIGDRRGWLRARSGSGLGWSNADLVCSAAEPRPAGGAGGLDTLLARIDAEPVRDLRGVAPH